MIDVNGYFVNAIVAAGMGVAFIVADRRSPTSWLLGVLFVLIGASITANICVVQGSGSVRIWSAVAGLCEAGALLTTHEWILRLRRTIPTRGLRTLLGDRVVRAGQALGLLYGALAMALPELRAREFVGLMRQNGAALPTGFWLFLGPFALSVVAGLFSVALLLNRKPDRAEKVRLVALCAAVPLLAGGLVLPKGWIASALGLVVFLVGAIRYHVFQGQRGQFLSRFLSPQVAEVVRSQGLDAAMRESTLELSVVSCDLRGFTALSERTPSQRVIQILREYYDAVGRVAAEFGATIKDHAGDGILLLVGAPIAYEDHARRAVQMAEGILRAVGGRVAGWGESGFELGVGIGIASGFVT
ncbi:MAG: adenylate/guanylate cyclase domain-containing protein, partial [Candidatus Binatia bacterium]